MSSPDGIEKELISTMIMSDVDFDADYQRALHHASLNAQLIKDLKENVHIEEENEEQDSGDEKRLIAATSSPSPEDINPQKTYVERRFYRSMLWGSIAWFLALGRGLSRCGVKGAHLGALRQVTRVGAGYRREEIDEVLHFKVKIAGVKTRVYRPANQKPGQRLPVCIFIHGGGWVMCTARTYHRFTLELCKDIESIVVSVDYRLAPEHPYPAPLDDCLNVTRAILESESNPDAVGPNLAGYMDLSRLILEGDSAGGNLACATCLDIIRNSEQPSPKIKALCLICPSLQAVSTRFPSIQKFAKKSTARAGWFLANYAGISDPSPRLVRCLRKGKHVPDEMTNQFVDQFINKWSADPSVTPPSDFGEFNIADRSDKHVPESVARLAISPRAWPMLAKKEHLALIPATMIQVCSDDSLKDEGVVFSQLLQRCGVEDVRCFHLPRAQHCEAIFHNTIPTKAAKLGYHQICQFIRDALKRK